MKLRVRDCVDLELNSSGLSAFTPSFTGEESEVFWKGRLSPGFTNSCVSTGCSHCNSTWASARNGLAFWCQNRTKHEAEGERGRERERTRRRANNIHKGLLYLINFEECVRSNKDAMWNMICGDNLCRTGLKGGKLDTTSVSENSTSTILCQKTEQPHHILYWKRI